MNVVVVAQDRSQVEAVYRDEAPAIFNNLGTTLFLSGSDARTRKHFSEALGCYTLEATTGSKSKGRNGNTTGDSTAYHEARLFRPEDLARWDYRTGHLVIDRGQAYACSSIPAWETFVGDELGMDGRKPDSQSAPPRADSNTTPAPVWRWDEREEGAEACMAQAIDEMFDPRFA